MESLPEELWFRIFEVGIQTSILMLKEISSLSLSCKLFNKLSKEDALWSLLLARDFPERQDEHQTQTLFLLLPRTKLVYKNTLGRDVKHRIAVTERMNALTDLFVFVTTSEIMAIRKRVLKVSAKMKKLCEGFGDDINEASAPPMNAVKQENLRIYQLFYRRIGEAREASLAIINNKRRYVDTGTAGPAPRIQQYSEELGYGDHDPFAPIDIHADAPISSTPNTPSPLIPYFVRIQTAANEFLPDLWDILSRHQHDQALVDKFLLEQQKYANLLKSLTSRMASLRSGPNPIIIGDEIEVVDIDFGINDDEEEDDDDDEEDEDDDADDDDDDVEDDDDEDDLDEDADEDMHFDEDANNDNNDDNH